MHDGRFATLREVIDHFDHGIQNSPNLDFQLLIGSVPKQMNLTESEKDDLEAFLNTLTDDAMANDPKFADPFP
jgi:cytochrome c peroxidase